MRPEDLHCLGETSIEDFLTLYWQKKPLLIRNAFADLQSPITANELAGMACEEQVNARLVFAEGDDKPGSKGKHWQVEFGPFDESRFSELPESNWSLLVSDVEKHLPETKAFLKKFHFIPDWRVDDLMISYAPPGGSVGPHTDAYDVFLIQLNGQRLWQINENYNEETLEDADLCILKNFTAEREWVLNAGDMLYLPPNVAHHGIAQSCKNTNGSNEQCLTASVGFRAPSLNTITNDYIHFLNENSHDTTRYSDKSPVKPAHHAEISDATVSHFIDYLKQGFTLEPELVKQWLGQFCSDNKTFEDFNHDKDDINFEQLVAITTQSALMHSPYSRFLFSYSDQAALLFVDGNSYPVSKAFAEEVCEDEHLDFQQLEKIMTVDDKNILLALFNNGAVVTLENS